MSSKFRFDPPVVDSQGVDALNGFAHVALLTTPRSIKAIRHVLADMAYLLELFVTVRFVLYDGMQFAPSFACDACEKIAPRKGLYTHRQCSCVRSAAFGP